MINKIIYVLVCNVVWFFYIGGYKYFFVNSGRKIDYEGKEKKIIKKKGDILFNCDIFWVNVIFL